MRRILDNCIGEVVDRLGRKHVELGAFRGLQSLELVSADIGGDDPGALRDECLRYGPADALASRSDKRQSFLFSLLPSLGIWHFFNGCRAASLFCATR